MNRPQSESKFIKKLFELFRNGSIVMSLRTVVLRQTRLLQTCNRPAIMPLSALNVVARRSFRVYAPRRTNGEDSKTTSADPSTGNTKSAEPAEEAASTSQPPSDSASKDVPPSPQKRDIDPKDREIAELKVLLFDILLIAG